MKGTIAIVIYTDADACPVKDEIDNIAGRYKIKSYLISTVDHSSFNTYHSSTIILDSVPEAVDMYIMNHMKENDLVITQDNGLAAMVLQKGGQVLTPRGYIYRKEDIEILLLGRYAGIQMKRRKIKPKRTPPFKKKDRQNFEIAMENLVKHQEQ